MKTSSAALPHTAWGPLPAGAGKAVVWNSSFSGAVIGRVSLCWEA